MTESTPRLPEWQSPPTPPEDTRPRELALEFTGSGSEYFRIWIVNLLLMILTLGIYYPWAKARRLRYFMGNTLVDGQPLGFHGDPKKMFKGFALVGVLFALYSAAGKFSSVAGLVALLIVAALWPALFKSSMQFRLANTSWRGLRFRFHGDLKGAYRALLPLFVPGVFLVGALVFVPNHAVPPLWYGVMAMAVGLAAMAVAPWLLWNLKQYQHNHYGLGHHQTTFNASAGAFYRLSLKTLGIGLLLIGLPLAVFVALAFSLKSQGAISPESKALMGMATTLPPLLGILATMVFTKPYAVTRFQNLVWSKTGNMELRFISKLRVRALLWRTVKNWFLIVLTLGLYWPFAAVALTRLRLEAVRIKSRRNPDLLVSQVQAQEGDAAGDAAGDFFGLDVGL